MTWDEAAIGYNGHAIFTTRRDEWLQFLPVSFQSFGDYKAPLAIYLNGIFTFLCGMNLWAVRLPFALAGVATVLGLMLLVRELLGKKWSLLAGVLLTLSPWHLHFSRAGFEAGLSLAFFIWGLYFFFSYLKRSQLRWSWWRFLLSILTAVASVYSYHSAKLVVPLVILILLVAEGRHFIKKIWLSLGGALISGTLLMPMLKDSIYGHGLTRFGTTIFDEVQGLALIKTVANQFLLHLSPQFLLSGQTTTLRHGGGVTAYLLPTTFILILFVFFYFLWQRHYLKNNERRFFWLGLLLLVVGLLPAAIGEEVPHSNRALLALPGFLFLATLGLKFLVTWIKQLKLNDKVNGSHGEKDMILCSVLGTLTLIHGLFFTNYLGAYYQDFASASAAAFKDGYLEAFNFVKEYEAEVDKILFTGNYGQPYIYALFARETNPIWYRGGSLRKYEFSDEINVGDLMREKTIIVASQDDELKTDLADYLVRGSDGEVRFKIYLPEELK